MLTAERRQVILQMLARDGKVLATELGTLLGVSEDTVRRDLRDMAEAGLLHRVYGGAMPAAVRAPDYAARQALDVRAKSAIAKAAAALVQNDQVIVMDGGTTNLEVAHQLPQTLRATIVTNCPPIAQALASHPYVEVLMVGGGLLKESQVTVGAEAVSTLQQIRSNLCLLGICSIHPEVGVTTDHVEEQPVKRAMLAGSAKVVALATGAKLGTVSPFVVGPLNRISCLITDGVVADDVLDPYRAAGVLVVKA